MGNVRKSHRIEKRGIKATAYSKNLLKLLRLEVNEAGFDSLDRVKLIRTDFLQLGGYLLDLCGGDAFEVSFLTVTEKLKTVRENPSPERVGPHVTNG